ncbi:hypothetical protein DM02DRAFT_552104, partial [Periconia macrospinosa]
ATRGKSNQPSCPTHHLLHQYLPLVYCVHIFCFIPTYLAQPAALSILYPLSSSSSSSSSLLHTWPRPLYPPTSHRQPSRAALPTLIRLRELHAQPCDLKLLLLPLYSFLLLPCQHPSSRAVQVRKRASSWCQICLRPGAVHRASCVVRRGALPAALPTPP